MQKIKKEVVVMPGFDGTGPNGMGSMTGGGRGRSGGRGHRCWFYATGLPGWMRVNKINGGIICV